MTLLLLLPGSDALSTPGRPTVAQVAAILRARTRGISSRDASVAGEHGTFDTTTRPTFAQVEELITLAVSELTGMLGGRAPCTDQLMLSAATAVAYRAAALCEISYFPEQTNDDQSAFKALQAMWKDSAAIIIQNIAEQCPLITDPGGVVSLSGMPTGRVPWRQATTWQEIH